MYEKLAAYYDTLVQDDEATAAWVKLVKQHVSGRQLLEVACGSGEITLALANEGYHMTAGDISHSMLNQAQAKKGSEAVDWHCFDMRCMKSFASYDAILCFCDSINYLTDFNDWRLFFTQAYDHLNEPGFLLFDMHTPDRLTEFSQEYCEAGYMDNTAYEWTISAQDDCIYHNFIFYDEAARPMLEQHVQRVYEPQRVLECLKEIGFAVEIYTDFTIPGIQSGEKYFLICKKDSAGGKQ